MIAPFVANRPVRRARIHVTFGQLKYPSDLTEALCTTGLPVLRLSSHPAGVTVLSVMLSSGIVPGRMVEGLKEFLPNLEELKVVSGSAEVQV